MFTVRVRTETPGIVMAVRFRSRALAALQKAAETAARTARGTARFRDRTGNLRRSIEVSRDTIARYDTRFTVGARKKYALFIEAGTKDHDVEARRAPVLRFRIAGKWISKKKVHVRGITPRKFMFEASEAGSRALLANLRNLL